MYSRLHKEILLINKEKNSNCNRKMGKEFGQANRRQTQEDNKHVTGYSKSLIICKMQIQTSIRYHLAPIRSAIIRKLGVAKLKGIW